MLQFIAKYNDRYSVPELAQMAIEGGCRWVVLDPGSASDPAIRELCTELVPLCREAEVILTMVDHIELARELGIHGVLLADGSCTLRQAREICGPEAIVGMVVADAQAALPMRDMGLDLDYVSWPVDMSLPEISANTAALHNDGFEIPVVASGDYPVELVPALMAAGVSGLALGEAIADADDPVEATREILREISPENKA